MQAMPVYGNDKARMDSDIIAEAPPIYERRSEQFCSIFHGSATGYVKENASPSIHHSCLFRCHRRRNGHPPSSSSSSCMSIDHITNIVITVSNNTPSPPSQHHLHSHTRHSSTCSIENDAKLRSLRPHRPTTLRFASGRAEVGAPMAPVPDTSPGPKNPRLELQNLNLQETDHSAMAEQNRKIAQEHSFLRTPCGSRLD